MAVAATVLAQTGMLTPVPRRGAGPCLPRPLAWRDRQGAGPAPPPAPPPTLQVADRAASEALSREA